MELMAGKVPHRDNGRCNGARTSGTTGAWSSGFSGRSRSSTGIDAVPAARHEAAGAARRCCSCTRTRSSPRTGCSTSSGAPSRRRAARRAARARLGAAQGAARRARSPLARGGTCSSSSRTRSTPRASSGCSRAEAPALGAGELEEAASDPSGGVGALARSAAAPTSPYESFAQAEIGRLEELRVRAAEERIEAELGLGRHADLVGELEALVAAHPLRERLRGQLMVALYRAGPPGGGARGLPRGCAACSSTSSASSRARRSRTLERAILRHDPSLERAGGAVLRAALVRRRARRAQARHRPRRRARRLARSSAAIPSAPARNLDRLREELAAEVETGRRPRRGLRRRRAHRGLRARPSRRRTMPSARSTRPLPCGDRLEEGFGDDGLAPRRRRDRRGRGRRGPHLHGAAGDASAMRFAHAAPPGAVCGGQARRGDGARRVRVRRRGGRARDAAPCSGRSR